MKSYASHTRDTMATAAVGLLDGGALSLYSDPRPANADQAPAGATLIGQVTLPTPAYNASSGGSALANSVPSATALVDGHISWFRMTAADGSPVFDGSCGLDRNADLTLLASHVSQGDSISLAGVDFVAPT